MADRAIERLKHGRDGNKPSCTWIRFPDPHHPFDCPEPWWRLNDPAEITLPEYRTRDFAMNEWELLPNRVGVALSLRGVRARTHKLTMDMRRGDGELYDLEDDPGEMTKVFDDPDHADIRQRLTGFLAQRSDDFAPNRKPVGPA